MSAPNAASPVASAEPVARPRPAALAGGPLRRVAAGTFAMSLTEWRKLRDGGVLEGKQPGEKVGSPTAEQAEIARLRQQLDRAERRLARTEVALDIMGKAHALLEDISESADQDERGEQPPKKR